MCDEKVKSHLTTGIQKQGILIMIEEDKFVIGRKERQNESYIGGSK